MNMIPSLDRSSSSLAGTAREAVRTSAEVSQEPDRSVQPTTSAYMRRQQALQQAERKPDPAALKSAVTQVNEFLKPVTQSLRFEVDQDSGAQVVKLVDTSTQKVLRQIPSEEAIAMSKALDRFQGFLVRTDV